MAKQSMDSVAAKTPMTAWFARFVKPINAAASALLALVFVCSTAQAESLEWGYEKGLQAYLSGDLNSAAQVWQSESLQQDPRVKFGLGVIFTSEDYLHTDVDKGMAYYEEAAKMGSVSAMYNLGLAYYLGRGASPDPKKAHDYWLSAAKLNHASAQYNLAAMLWSGVGLEVDKPSALRWFRTANKNGSDQASGFLNELFQPMYLRVKSQYADSSAVPDLKIKSFAYDIGTYHLAKHAKEQSQVEDALDYWTQLAEAGHVRSQYELARLYESGEVANSNPDFALNWYELAAKNGEPNAQYRLARYYLEDPVAGNQGLALYWMQTAADNGITDAQTYLQNNR